ncbi:cytochrome c family protein [Trichloromonas sp.]|uniref:cytochrome c family protein n=1 Tax=Trichloromonas sp. TaxID=3069249 RepID=UPI002A4B21B8|nr:cytochrome c family protein [Trichloromonas sp.]
MMMKKLLMLLCLTFVATSAFADPPPVFPVDRDFYPYYPSLIKYEKSGAEFTPPEACADCHAQQYEEWTGSIHALAFKDPVYQGELNLAVKAVGHEISRQCEGCHSPAGVVTGEIKGPGLKGLSPMALAGVSCDVCHSIVGTTHCQTPTREPENGSFIIRPGVDTPEGPQLRKRGPVAASEDCGMGFHECDESPLHLQADLCAGCHQVYHYDKHFPLESTYLEWKHGAYAQKTIFCQDCHMVDLETFKRTADDFKKPERHEYRHYFNGANYLLYYLASGAAKKAGDEALAANIMNKYEMAVGRLKAAADLDVTPVYNNGQLAEVKVRVKNIRAGHNLPTSLTNIRQLWLEITATDEKGQVVMTSGAVDANGQLPENTRLFNSEGMGDDFHFAVDPWVITAFSRHDTIPPKGHKDVYYGINAGASPVVKLDVKLRYRQADQKIAEKLLASVPADIDLNATYGLTAVPPLPVVDMVAKQVSFPTRQ